MRVTLDRWTVLLLGELSRMSRYQPTPSQERPSRRPNMQHLIRQQLRQSANSRSST